MSRRSPNYPSIDLGSAIDALRAVFLKEGHNTVTREQLAQHLGFSRLSGRANERIAALRAYGLIEGRRNEMRISDDMITLLAAPKGTAERRGAVSRRAYHSAIFRKILSLRNDEHISEPDLRTWLKERSFTPGAVERLMVSYFTTMKLVADEGGGSHLLKGGAGGTAKKRLEPSDRSFATVQPAIPSSYPGSRREVIALPEGDVTITFPEPMTIESYEDLATFLQLFLKKAKRSALTHKEIQ